MRGISFFPFLSLVALLPLFSCVTTKELKIPSQTIQQLLIWFEGHGGMIHEDLELKYLDEEEQWVLALKRDVRWSNDTKKEKQYLNLIVTPQFLTVNPYTALLSLVENIKKLSALSKLPSVTTAMLGGALDYHGPHDNIKGRNAGKSSSSHESLKATLALYLMVHLDDPNHPFQPWFSSLPRGCQNHLCQKLSEKDAADGKLATKIATYTDIAKQLGLDVQAFLEMLSLVDTIALDHAPLYESRKNGNKASTSNNDIIDSYVLAPLVHTLLPKRSKRSVFLHALKNVNYEPVEVTLRQKKFQGVYCQSLTSKTLAKGKYIAFLVESVSHPAATSHYLPFTPSPPLQVSTRQGAPLPTPDYDFYRQWFIEHGGYCHPHLHLRPVPGWQNVRGFFATENIKDGEVILAAPQHLLQNDYGMLHSLVENMPDLRRKSKLGKELTIRKLMETLGLDGPDDSLKGVSDSGELLESDMARKGAGALYFFVHSDNPTHTLYPWYTVLPRNCMNYKCWTEEKIHQSFIPEVATEAWAKQVVYRKMAERLGLYDVEGFMQKVSIINSRGWFAGVSRSYGPFVDMINHAPPGYIGAEDRWNQKRMQGMIYKLDGTKADKDTQVFANYGKKTNADLLYYYGFMVDYNPNDNCQDLQAILTDEVIATIKLPPNVTCAPAHPKTPAPPSKSSFSYFSLVFPISLSVPSLFSLIVAISLSAVPVAMLYCVFKLFDRYFPK
eukprot:g12082.t1